jgi:hypothetical protein
MHDPRSTVRDCSANANLVVGVERFLHSTAVGGITAMNLVVWLPAMFVLGLVVMGLCYAFIDACEKV